MSEETPRLYLATPLVDAPETFLPHLRAALEAADVASLLLRLRTSDPAEAESAIRAVAAIAQPSDVAVVVEGEADLVIRSGADGLHVTRGEEQLGGALARLSPDYIVGAGALSDRDDAMRAGEAGADYVLFGEAGADDPAPSAEDVLERTRWWAEIFNTPCVALARRLDEIGPLAEAGADFVMVGEAIWNDPRGPADAMRDAASRLAARTP
ncbi:MAG: thiamine phosphate synthase [Methylocystaceae bacterium]|nr:MAG: thiamine phosphate synthase [Methylocystaceae bacterium]